MNRKSYIALTVSCLALCAICLNPQGKEKPETKKQSADEASTSAFSEAEIKAFFKDRLPTRDDVRDYLAEKAFPFCKYDAVVGYLHRNRRFREGIDQSVVSYHYDANAARHTINHANQSCRINTYGDSFTSCEQVNDGETWQEHLAAHLNEPVRNFGIGGYSVYLSYLRMKREEAKAPAKYIIFNVFDDDHYRNLISWQRITYPTGKKAFHPTLPHVKVNMGKGEIIECPNPCPTAESVYNLCNLDWVYNTFKDDFVLKITLAERNTAGSQDIITQLAQKQGIRTQVNYSGENLDKNAKSLYTEMAIFATMRIVDKVEDFAKANNKIVLYVLSYGGQNIAKRIQEGTRFDQKFVDFLQQKQLPYVDLMEAHLADYQKGKSNIEDYLNRYYIGHYNPTGNLFCAMAIKKKLVGMLDPKPASYNEQNIDVSE